MTNLKIIIAAIFFSGIISCKKTEKTSVKVISIDYYSKKRVPNVQIDLKEIETRGNSVTTQTKSEKILKTGYTDVNGQIDFGGFEAEKSRKYEYRAYASSMNNFINKGEKNDIISTAGYSVEVTVQLIPPPPYAAGDSIRVNFINEYNPEANPKITNVNYFIKGHFLCPIGYDYISIDKYKSGIFTNTTDTVYYDFQDHINEYDVYW